MNIEFTKDDADIIVELLTYEANRLPVEIHHCRTNDYKDMLKKKKKMVDDLIEKIKIIQ